MRVSVICTTYNSARWLEKVIWGYSVQTHRAFELLIADDGSHDDTARVIRTMGRDTGVALRHVWHEHHGFRKCAILNQAIAAARSEYLVFTDGDCVPRRDFLAQHVRLARRGRFLSGGAVRLPLALSQNLARDDILDGGAFEPAWLMAQGLPLGTDLLKLCRNRGLAALLDALTPTRATWNGHNCSGWKDDILAANGFDERMAYGGLDRELGERLVNAGLRPRQVRHRAICLHLDHARGYVSAEGWARNRHIRQQTRNDGLTWTTHGIVKGPRLLAAEAEASDHERGDPSGELLQPRRRAA